MKTNPALQIVAVNSLTTGFLDIRTQAQDPAVAGSIRRVGILSPLLARERGKGLEIIDGHRRWTQIAQTRPDGTVPCLVYPASLSDWGCLELFLHANAFGGRLSPVEKGRLVALLDATAPPGAAPLPLFLLQRTLGDSMKKASLLQDLLKLPDAVLAVVDSETLTPKAAAFLLDLDGENATALAEAVAAFRFGASRQTSFLRTAVEVMCREGLAAQALLSALGEKELLDDGERPLPQRAKDLLSRLFGRRFPERSLAEKTVRESLGKLHLPPNVSIVPPDGLEAEEFRLDLRFRDPGELEKLARVLEKAAKSSDLVEALRGGLPT